MYVPGGGGEHAPVGAELTEGDRSRVAHLTAVNRQRLQHICFTIHVAANGTIEACIYAWKADMVKLKKCANKLRANKNKKKRYQQNKRVVVRPQASSFYDTTPTHILAQIMYM